MTGILEQLELDALKMRRKDSRLVMFYKDLKVAASIPTNDHVPPNRRTRNHPGHFNSPIGWECLYTFSFFPQTIRGWNSLADSIISASESAEDFCRARN